MSKHLILQGLAGSPGIVEAEVVFTSEKAEVMEKPVVLFMLETEPKDFYGMAKAKAIVTATGSIGSHAVLVSKQLKIPCVVGLGKDNIIIFNEGELRINKRRFHEGDLVCVDGDNGVVTLRKSRKKKIA
jgi:pyruvate,orthophosphate dikinase